VLKVHHSAIDGISLAATLNALHQQAGDSAQRPQPTRKTKAPSQWDIWTRANLNTISRQLKLVETVGNLLPGFKRARETREKFKDLPPTHRSRARFNDSVSPNRSTGTLLLQRSDLLAIRRAVRHVTFNDMAMACVAGALREYLQFHGELPADSLVSGTPINLRDAADDQPGGNKIATMMVGLATHIADPVERLRMVHRYAVAGKKQINALGTGTVMDISDSVAPGILAEGIRTLAWASRMADVPIPFHTMISNVPGPHYRVTLGEAELAACLGLGPVRDNMGLFHIVSNSEKTFSLSFSACSKLLPDPGFYQACLRKSFIELRERALADA
jgi:WS/DGAT/MGAT family acyltransferase